MNVGGLALGKNLTIYVPDDVAEKMAMFPEVNWSEICRRAIIEYLGVREKDLDLVRRVALEAAYEVVSEHLEDYEHKEKPLKPEMLVK